MAPRSVMLRGQDAKVCVLHDLLLLVADIETH